MTMLSSFFLCLGGAIGLVVGLYLGSEGGYQTGKKDEKSKRIANLHQLN